MEEVRSGRRPFVRLDVLHRENLVAILPEYGIDPARVPSSELDTLKSRLAPARSLAGCNRGASATEAAFYPGATLHGNIILMLDMAKRAGLPWDAILGAEIVQTYKPAPRAYLGTAEVLAMRPDELCLVAAHNSDLAAARSCGLRTIFVPRLQEHGPAQTIDLRAGRIGICWRRISLTLRRSSEPRTRCSLN